MSLADKVAALRAFFGVKPEVQLLPAVEAMHAAMGSVAEGPLPTQVDALVSCLKGVCGGESLFLKVILAKFGPRFLMIRFLNARV